MLDTSLDDRSF